MSSLGFDSIVMAQIGDKIIKIDWASTNRNAYQDIQKKLEYLGMGTYYSINDVKQTEKNWTHFWKWKN